MCLFTTFKSPRVAEEDITCYKVVRDGSWCTPMISPYKDFEWEFDIEYSTENEKCLEPDYDEYHKGYFIGEGFFHTFKYKEDAYNIVEKLSWNGRRNIYTIVKSIIPKGSLIYDGPLGDFTQTHGEVMEGAICYASNKLKLVDYV